MKTCTTQYETFTTTDGEELELELPVRVESWEDPDVQIVETPHYVILGYLAHDNDCENPLESCDAIGEIHHHPRSRYGSRDSEYYDILGCDSYGDPRIDEDKVQAMWRDKVLALPEERFVPPEEFEEELFEPCPIYSSRGEPEPYWKHFQLRLADEAAGDYDVEMMARYAWRRMDVSEELINTLIEQVTKHIEWDWDEVQNVCHERGDIDAVLLDRYEHGLCRYSVHSNGGCPWDTSHGEAVWIPDKYLREELEKITDHEAHWKQAVEWAEQACESYTDWCNGNCYGHVIGVYDKVDGELVEEDSCWGYVGDEGAKESLKEMMDHFVEKYQARIHDPNQLLLTLTNSVSEGERA